MIDFTGIVDPLTLELLLHMHLNQRSAYTGIRTWGLKLA